MAGRTPDSEQLLTPAEVAAMFRVDPKTVTRWAKAGKLTSIRTLGGHRRYRASEVRALLEGVPQPRDGADTGAIPVVPPPPPPPPPVHPSPSGPPGSGPPAPSPPAPAERDEDA